MRTGRTVGLWLASLAICACAKGGAPVADDVQDDPDARVTIDGPPGQIDATVTTPDAMVPPPDAFVPPPDAFVPPPDAFVPPPDAANPTFCEINNDCTVPGTCCFLFQCVEGTGVGENICFPAE